jgi:hypothetical protein
VIRCECGFEVRAAAERGLAVQVRRHALEVHGMVLSPKEARLVMLGSPRDEAAEPDEELPPW